MRTIARMAVALALGVGLAGAVDAVAPTPAHAQSEGDLAAARKLFADALKDEEGGRWPEALEKLRRVQEVRDTQQVRYRIARCLEATGHLRDAIAAYGAAAIAGTREHESAEIARASHDKVEALSRRVARLVVRLSARAPGDAQVKIDGEAVQPNAIGTPQAIDPGPHEITGTATGAPPFHAQMTIPEGGEAALDVPLDPSMPAPAPAAAPAPEPAPPPPAPVIASKPPPPPPSSPSSVRSTVGTLSLAAGGALLTTGVILLILRHQEIGTIEAACPGGVCPSSRAGEVTLARDHAVVEGPVGVVLGVIGVAGAGLGIYLLATPDRAGGAVAVHPWIGPGGGGLSVARTF